MYIKICNLTSHQANLLWHCNLDILARISLKLVVIKKSDTSIYIGSKEMKCEKRKKNGIGYSRDICFNCSSLYCFRIITKSKINSYSCITSGMLSISNLDYLAMSKLSLLWTNLMSPFSKYSFNSCLILQAKIYINIFFLKDNFKDPWYTTNW